MGSKKGNVLAIMSPKGGAGKTTITANLAVALSTIFNKKVLAIDTNISTASLGLHLNIMYPKVTIHDVLKKSFSLQQAAYPYNSNLYVIPASITIERDEDLDTMQEKVRKITDHYNILLSQVTDDYDIILLDSAPGFSIESIATMQVADGVMLVTNPEYPALASAIKAVEYAKILNVPMMGVVINKATKVKGELTKEDVEGALKVKVAQVIPMDFNVIKSVAKKIPVVAYSPYSPASIAFKRLAASIINKEYNPIFLEMVKSFFSRFI
jgi:septum site-determining protein MinD